MGCRAAIYQEIAAADIAAIAAHNKFRQRANFIRGAAASGGQVGEHGAVEILAFAVQFVVGKRGEDDAGADAVQPRAAFAPAHRFGGDTQCIAALGDLVGAQRVGLVFDQRQFRQLLRRQGGERALVGLIQIAKAEAGL